MKKRESGVFSLSIIIVLLIVAPAFAVLDGVKDVSAFTTTYDGSSSPAGTSIEGGGGSYTWSSDGDVLSLDSPGASVWTYDRTFPLGTPSSWTVEFEAKIYDTTGDDDNAGLTVDLRQTAGSTGIVVAKDYITLRTGTDTAVQISSPNNVSNAESTGFNRFRMAYDGTNIYVWRNGLDGSGWKVIADASTGLTARSDGTRDQLDFGDSATGASSALRADIDFIAFDLTGAYNVPEPTTMILLAAGSLLCILRKRR